MYGVGGEDLPQLYGYIWINETIQLKVVIHLKVLYKNFDAESLKL